MQLPKIKMLLRKLIEAEFNCKIINTTKNELEVKIEGNFEKINEELYHKLKERNDIIEIKVKEISLFSNHRGINYLCVVEKKTLTARIRSFNIKIKLPENTKIDDDVIGIKMLFGILLEDGKNIDTEVLLPLEVRVRDFYPTVIRKIFTPFNVKIDANGVIKSINGDDNILITIKNNSTINSGEITPEILTVKCYRNDDYIEIAPIGLRIKEIKKLNGVEQENILQPQEEADFRLIFEVEKINNELLRSNESKNNPITIYLLVYSINIEKPIDVIKDIAQEYILRIHSIHG